MTEEDVKLKYITPAIEAAGWDRNKQIRMEYSINAGKIIVRSGIAKRAKKLKADYVLFYKENMPLAIIEAKDDNHLIGDGMQQAQNYAEKLDIRFVFSSNGDGFLFYDMKTAEQRHISLEEFPSPKELFEKEYKNEINEFPNYKTILDTSYYYSEETFSPRYYQRIAINRTVEAIAKGKERALLVMATGTGKTYMAFQIIWRLWKSGLKKRILYLADRNILVDQTIIGDFKPFKNSMYKVEHKKMDTSYEIYLSLYQQLADNDSNDTLSILKENFKPNFFDLIIVDECHRGSAREDSNWRKILDYFSCASKIGLTATPKETKEISNIDYFGEPVYTYSLKDGIEDGYLAPYQVIRYSLDTDVFGYRPSKGKRDKNGELVEDREYGVKDFDKNLVIDERTQLVAEKITEYLKSINDRYAKTIVFCVDIDHAERMRRALVNLNQDLCKENYKYIMRITGDNDEGKKQLDNFIDPDSDYPTIVTTSKLMTTGVNCQTCKIIALDNNFSDENGMTEFKQIIGRGTRIKEDYGKMFFTILDFRNATRLFADPNFNGPEIQDIDYDPNNSKGKTPVGIVDEGNKEISLSKEKSKKVYINNVEVTLVSERVQYYDEDGKLVTESLKDFTKRNVLNDFQSLDDFLNLWTSNEKKAAIIQELADKGIFIEELRKFYPANVDDFDLICDIAYGIKPLTKSERAKKSKVNEVLSKYSEKCREVLQILLDKYSNCEIFDIMDSKILKLPEFNEYGNPMKIANMFGGLNGYTNAVHQIQEALYI